MYFSESQLEEWGCTEYISLSDRRRNYLEPTSGATGGHLCDKVNSTNGNGQNAGRTARDWVGPNWYRFISDAGTQLTQNPVPEVHCGTHIGGWLQGSHPVNKGTTYDRKVCFNKNSEQSLDVCPWSVQIKVRHCGEYFLYYLPDAPACNVGYCAQ